MRGINPQVIGAVFAAGIVHVIFTVTFPQYFWGMKDGFSIMGVIKLFLTVVVFVTLGMGILNFTKRGEDSARAESAREGSGWFRNRKGDALRKMGLSGMREEWKKLYNRPGMEPELLYRNRLLVMRVYDQALRYDIYKKKITELDKIVGAIIELRKRSGQKAYKSIEKELVAFRSQKRGDRGPDKVDGAVGWSSLIKESIDKLNEIHAGLTSSNPPTQSQIEGWTGTLSSLSTSMSKSFKEYRTKEEYLSQYHPLRAQILRLPLFELSPVEELKLIRKYALEGGDKNVEGELMKEWRVFLRDFQAGTTHPSSRTVGQYIDAWRKNVFNDDKIGSSRRGSENDPSFDWRALSTGSYTWNGSKDVEEPHISVIGLWQFFDGLIEKISGQTEDDKRVLNTITPYSTLDKSNSAPSERQTSDTGSASDRLATEEKPQENSR